MVFSLGADAFLHRPVAKHVDAAADFCYLLTCLDGVCLAKRKGRRAIDS